MKNKFYITTAIDYVNAEPHIGHAYQKIIADVLTRWNKIKGKETFFLTGTDEHGQKIAKSAEENKKPRESYELGIVFKENNELIGCIGLTNVNLWDKKATLGYWLSKKYWRLGIMYEACGEILKFAFKTLKLQRIDITAAVENEASNNLIKKLRASFEGTAKRYHRTKSTGKYHDANLYGLLKEEWKNG